MCYGYQNGYVLIKFLPFPRLVNVVLFPIGTQTWEPNSLNVIKRYQLETKDHATTTHSLGFRITGMRVFRKDTNDYVVHGKEDCMRLAKEDTCEAFLKNFFMVCNI